MSYLRARISLLVSVLSLALALAVPAVAGAAGGPIILAGVDAEDGGIGGHGPIENYATMTQSILGGVTNGGSGILVFGGGSGTDVESFWKAISQRTGAPVTFATGNAVGSTSLAGFAMVAVASSADTTPGGGLTAADNTALAGRRGDLVNFVNAGGGLLGFSQTGFAEPYAYLGFGGVKVEIGLSYSDITPDFYGQYSGLTDALDITAWHDEYISYPGFMRVLAINPATGNPAAIGGRTVRVDPGCSSALNLRPITCALAPAEQQQVVAEQAVTLVQQEGTTALAACGAAKGGKKVKGKRKKALIAGAKILCDLQLDEALLNGAMTGTLTAATPTPAAAVISPGVLADTTKLTELPAITSRKAKKVKSSACSKRDKTCKSLIKSFNTYSQAVANHISIAEARAAALTRLYAATTRGSAQATSAQLQLGAVKALSGILQAAATARNKAGANLSKAITKARTNYKATKKDAARVATDLTKSARSKANTRAAGMATRSTVGSAGRDGQLVRQTFSGIPAKALNLGSAVKVKPENKQDNRLNQHVRIGESRTVLDALASKGQVSQGLKAGLQADLDRAACAGSVPDRQAQIRLFIDKTVKQSRGAAQQILTGIAQGLATYVEGISEPIGECKPPPPLLPPPAIGDITEYANGLSANAGIVDLTRGPSTDVWFVEEAGRVGKIDAQGGITEYPLNRANRKPVSIFASPEDDFLYVAEQNSAGPGAILKVNPADGTVTEAVPATTPPCGNSQPQAITADSSFVWFTLAGCGAVGRYDPTGNVVTYVAIQNAADTPRGIGLVGGRVWYTLSNVDRIGYIDNTFSNPPTATEITTPAGGGKTYAVAEGPDFDAWFIGEGGLVHVRDDFTGDKIAADVGASEGVHSLLRGPDGNLWFTESSQNRVARYTQSSGAIDRFTKGLSANAGLRGIVQGNDGNLWIAEQTANRLGQVLLRTTP